MRLTRYVTHWVVVMTKSVNTNEVPRAVAGKSNHTLFHSVCEPALKMPCKTAYDLHSVSSRTQSLR